MSIDASFNINDNNAGVDASWSSKTYGLTVNAVADVNDKLKEIGFTKEGTIADKAVSFKGTFDNIKKKFATITKATVTDNLKAELKYDTIAEDPVLKVDVKIDDRHTVSPSVSLKNGDSSYKISRKLDGGSIEANFKPNDNVVLEWKDEGSHGTWTTKADIPIKDQSQTKLSFSHEWKL